MARHLGRDHLDTALAHERQQRVHLRGFRVVRVDGTATPSMRVPIEPITPVCRD
jgi:hypothetical protein